MDWATLFDVYHKHIRFDVHFDEMYTFDSNVVASIHVTDTF
jgi:hypothetical protein